MERDPEQKIHNCQILHYTRRDETGELHPYYQTVRLIRPDTGWSMLQRIERESFTNDELRKLLETA